MKALILLSIITITSYAHAKCVVALNTKDLGRAYTHNLLKTQHLDKVKSIMNSKGYEVKTKSDGSEDYTLNVSAVQHLMCGYSSTHASFSESITSTTEYSVDFKVSNGNEVFSKNKSYERYFFAFPGLVAKKGLMKAVEQIPACE